MKLVNDKNTLKTNFKGESENFGIGDASVVIEILRNRLYKNKIQTLVQEYCSNARDAMREIDSDKPIRVSVPSLIEPTFKVRDFGPGVSPDRMSSVFVLYGASTKRQDNKETGGFGIGAKSAWAYTDSFTIITFIDGIKRTYIAHTGESSNGRLDLISTENTDEENGTEIQIAVSSHDIDSFKKAVLRATYFWTESVELRGDIESPIREKGKMFTDHLEIQKDLPSYISPYYRKVDIAVIDGIPYSLHDLSEKVDELVELRALINRPFILHVPNGFLEVSASREEISDSKHTLKNLKLLCTKLLEQAHKTIKKEFSAISEVKEYFKKYIELSDKFNLKDYTSYKGYDIGYMAGYSGLHCDLFELVEVYKCFSDARGLRKEYLSKRFSKIRIPLKALDYIYFDQSDDSQIKVNKRLRALLSELDFGEHIYLIKPKKAPDTGDQKPFDVAYKALKKDLKIKDLSDVEIKKVTIRPDLKAKKKLESDEVCLHLLRRGTQEFSARYFEDITLSSNKQKYLYVVLDGGSWVKYPKDQCYSLQKYLKDYKICGISKTNLKKIKGDKNFTPLDKFLDSYKPTGTDINSYKDEKIAYYKDDIKNLNNLVGIKSKFLNKFLKEFNNLGNTSLIPALIEDKVKNDAKSKRADSQIEKFKNLLDNDLIIVKKLLDESRRLDDNIKKELVKYINAKTEGTL